jgi:hypothetical protein
VEEERADALEVAAQANEEGEEEKKYDKEVVVSFW